MNGNKPKVFVCSTIYDFRDLRSALRLWLEEYGYEVLVSEFNDFPQVPDENSYNSCLQAIDQCDYFILLIGRRVGGWVNQPNRLSITRLEYRRAYERSKQGSVKLLVFVRKEIWDVREDRQALKTLLEEDQALQQELSPEAKAKLVNHPSKFMNDAEFVIDFLQEVGRVVEMKVATVGAGVFPGGNWIYQFASFRDVIDASRTVLKLPSNLRQRALVANLQHEIKCNLRELLTRVNDTTRPATCWSRAARAKFRGGADDSSTYTGRDLVHLYIFLISVGNIGLYMGVRALWEAITSGEFLDFDKTTGAFTVGPLQNAMVELATHIDRLRHIPPATVWEVAMKLLTPEIKSRREEEFTKQNVGLLAAFVFHDLIENIASLCRGAYRALDGDQHALGEVHLLPSSPLEGEPTKIERETPSIPDVEKWLEAG